MHHAAILAASLGSLGLVCAIYYCNILSSPGSRLRGEMLAMILLSLLVGFFPLGLVGSVIGLANVLTGGFSLAVVLSAGADLVSLGAALATLVVFRALLKATNRRTHAPDNVTPLSPRPSSPSSTSGTFKKAA
ncbi:hypothetical protein [Tropicimonas sediminicola]|uniref:Uncharacterized protein n=1 Tax=Tropicimonas sediminicola TaxID=1031541 RepID=A0A239LAT8_9RHOB|nr:hypothetical protein [Tropicimonas sediminicola]SNT27028.1 hypothetical protein SAMN05421757_10957 [Tropicimonas sediminicola]